MAAERGRETETPDERPPLPEEPQAAAGRSGHRGGSLVSIPAVAVPVPNGASPQSDGATDNPSEKTLLLSCFCGATEVLADAVKRAYDKWIKKEPQNRAAGIECGKQLARLHVQTLDVISQYEHLLGSRAAGGESDPLDDAITEFERLGIGDVLRRLAEILDRLSSRMAEPYCIADQDRINQDFRNLAQGAQALNQVAQAVRTRIANRAAFQTFGREEIEQLIRTIHGATRKMLAPDVEPVASHDGFKAVLKAHMLHAEKQQKAYADIKKEIEKLFVKFEATVREGDISLFNDLEDFLTELGQRLTALEECRLFAIGVFNAAYTLDDNLPDFSQALKRKLVEVQEGHAEAMALIARYRELVERAPFRRFERTTPLTEWAALDEKEQRVVSAVIRLREQHPISRLFTATQQQIQVAMGCPEGRKSLKSVFKVLERLEELEILGSYSQPPMRKRQQAVNQFWIHEDAFSRFRAHVLGDGLT